MKKMEKFRHVALGCALALLVSSAITPAVAALAAKTIEVYTGVDIYIDDVKLNPTDANGNAVEAFVYNGTTYLPVRAVGEAVGKTVQWEGSTSSVYLGKHTSDVPAVLLEDLDYFTGKYWSEDSVKKDNLGNTYNSAIRLYSADNTYKLNGQYSKITGTLFQRYDQRSYDYDSTLKIYGDGKLLYEATVSAGVEPIYFDVPLTGVLELEIITTAGYGAGASIGDCGLWT